MADRIRASRTWATLGVILLLLCAPAPYAVGADPTAAQPGGTASTGHTINVSAVASHTPPVLQSPDQLAAVAQAVPATAAPAVAATSPGIAATHGSYGWNDVLANCTARPCYEPPNPGVAVGTLGVVDWTDEGLTFLDHDGQFLSTVTRQVFFGELSGQAFAGDTTVVFDSLHDRWLAAEVSTDCLTGHVYLAVSASADATGTWKQYQWTYAGRQPTLPAIGVTSDKILLEVRFVDVRTCAYAGGGTSSLTVADAAAVYAMPASLSTTTLTDPSLNEFRPAVSQSETTTGFLVGASKVDSSTFTFDVGYATVTGTVAGGDVAISNDQDLTGVGLASINTTDYELARIHGGVPMVPTQLIWSGDRLWFALTYLGAVPSVKAVQLDTTMPASPALLQEVNVGDGVAPTFAPGIALGGDGSMWLAMARATPSGAIEPYAAYQAAGDAPGTLRTPARLMAAGGAYAGTAWGPSSGIAWDPTDPTSVWHHAPASVIDGGWLTDVCKLSDGHTAAPTGTVTIDDGAASTVYMRVEIASELGANSGVTEFRVSNSSTMSPSVEGPSQDLASWQLDNLAFGGSKTTGQRTVYVQFGDGAGNWSSVVSGSISLDASVPVTRLSGPDRYATAAAISKATYAPGVRYAFIASGLNFPDALAGASAAGWYGSPILFVGSTLPQATITELQRLQPDTIVVLGGTGVVSAGIATALAQYATSHQVIRLAGADRFATAAAISQWAYPGGVPFVFITYGYNFPDALAAAPVAGYLGAPILFTKTTSIPRATTDELSRLHPGSILVAGGTGVISSAVESQLAAYAGEGGVVRLAGPDRYSTAATIVDSYWGQGIDGAFIASGLNFPDALAGAAAAAWLGNPILFVGTELPATTADELDWLMPKQDWILGGTGVVSNTIASQLAGHLGP